MSANPDELKTKKDYEEPGTGWLFMAGTILGIAGVMRVIDSIWAFSAKESLHENLEDGVLGSNLKTYGWVWLIVGILLIASSVMILSRSQFARWVGFIAAGVAAITAITWMPYYPVWAFTYIALSMLVIYALAAYGGREMSS